MANPVSIYSETNGSAVKVSTDGGMKVSGIGESDVYKYVIATSLAAGASVNLWTPTAGKKFRLSSITVVGSGAGLLELYDGATNEFAMIGVTSQHATTTVPFGSGYTSTAIDNVLSAKNYAGGTTTFYITLYGTEV